MTGGVICLRLTAAKRMGLWWDKGLESWLAENLDPAEAV